MPADLHFPINVSLPEILGSLATHPRLVLEAPPGAGKTTQVPLALLKADWCTGKILMLEPRRIAARAAATFMATQLGESVGATVGYQIRFERRLSEATRIEIVTEGILTRMVQDDPSLEGFSAVLFDEFHERHLSSDLGLALCLDIQQSLRPELRMLVMSATLDGERLARFIDAPRITTAGRSFPVQITHLAARPQDSAGAHFARAVRRALEENEGDVLCFLPGKFEIDRAMRSLGDLDAELEALHGEMTISEQARLLGAGTRRRVILATNVAESSITLPSVRAVVDTGQAREPRFDPASGMSRLETVAIAQSSAVQRAGRAGRVAPGTCYRLWPESQRLDSATRPELQRIELCSFLLEMKSWGNEALRFLDAPPPGALAQALDLLHSLEAVDATGRPTAHGKRLLELGVHPRLGNAMLRAPGALSGVACDVAAMLDARDPLRGDARRSDALLTRMTALHALRTGRLSRQQADLGALQRIDQAAQMWRRRLKATEIASLPPAADEIGLILALAYPDRIARMDVNNPRRYQLSNGRGAQLLHESTLVGEPWLAIAEIRFDNRVSLILRAAPLDKTVLEATFPTRFTHARSLSFNTETHAVETRDQRRFSALMLTDRLVPTTRDAATADLLLEGIRQAGLQALPWREGLREWQLRIENLRVWCPEINLPNLSDEVLASTLSEWLRPRLEGRRKLDEFSPEEFHETLHGLLDYAARQILNAEAPIDLLVPSGMRRRLLYTSGQPPVLAVKLQELFGLGDTPRIAKGRVPVVLHLLSPRQTPIQVTQDLRGFWERTYPAVKKEMKGRYPKHPWPEDPWTATATHRAKPRRQ